MYTWSHEARRSIEKERERVETLQQPLYRNVSHVCQMIYRRSEANCLNESLSQVNQATLIVAIVMKL